MKLMGVGLDLLDIARMAPLLEKDAFMNRVFTGPERAYISGRGKMAATSAAGIFCAKEALGKALGAGLSNELFRDAEVRHDALGRPFFAMSGALAGRYPGCRTALSITHTATTAAAVVVLEKE